jgi:hypothetical protein
MISAIKKKKQTKGGNARFTTSRKQSVPSTSPTPEQKAFHYPNETHAIILKSSYLSRLLPAQKKRENHISKRFLAVLDGS